VICDGIKKNISSFTLAQVKIEKLLDTAASTASSSTELKVSSLSLPNTDPYRIEGLDDINKSSIINFEFDSSINWFEGLIGIKKLAFCIILGKGILISAISSIVFIYYGDVLIEKYDLVNKYPKIAKFIELRRKYQKYYLIFNSLLIVIVVITEILVGLSILTL
jgi:hypothetical protein